MSSSVSRCYEKERSHDGISLGNADLHKHWFHHAGFLSLYYANIHSEYLRGPTAHNIFQTYMTIEPFPKEHSEWQVFRGWYFGNFE